MVDEPLPIRLVGARSIFSFHMLLRTRRTPYGFHRFLPPLVSAAVLSSVILFATPAVSEPNQRPGKCSGELSRLPEGEWVIRTGREGICAFRGEDVKTKVLAVCSEGQGCEVTGLLGDCEDPECTEIRRVRSVRPVRLRRR
jgi:hypothetical protein